MFPELQVDTRNKSPWTSRVLATTRRGQWIIKALVKAMDLV
jgi:hypothetical protein